MDQTGTGHFSCIGGYDPETNKVLVLDTARFKYPPFWVDFDMLCKSLASLDIDTGKKRGFIVASRKQKEQDLDGDVIVQKNDLTLEEIQAQLHYLNNEVKFKVFKFIHDLNMFEESCSEKQESCCEKKADSDFKFSICDVFESSENKS